MATTQIQLLSAQSLPLIDYFVWILWKLTNVNMRIVSTHHDECICMVHFNLLLLWKLHSHTLHVCICVCAVSEPTLKWKLRKIIATRPNPLQRKISAPPDVKHRTETLGMNI